MFVLGKLAHTVRPASLMAVRPIAAINVGMVSHLHTSFKVLQGVKVSSTTLSKIPRRVILHDEPPRPKRRTAYTLYSEQMHMEGKAPHGKGGDITSASRAYSELWNKLSPDVQKAYKDRSKADFERATKTWNDWFAAQSIERQREIQEWSKMQGASDMSNPDLPSAYGALGRPTPPRRAFDIFYAAFRQEALKNKAIMTIGNPTARAKEISQKASETWRVLTDEDKKKYRVHADQTKEVWLKWHGERGYDPNPKRV